MKSNGVASLGIDLGTTYSVVAFLDGSGRPVTLPNAAGDLITPSAILIDEGELIIGKEAVKAGIGNPDNFADCVKRDMGRPVFRRPLRGYQVPPEVLSAFILEYLKRQAERKLGKIDQAVITVPAFFDETRRKATQDAGRLAGFKDVEIINEPTAAAVSFGYNSSQRRAEPASSERILVYDLGGGTFDVTVLEIGGKTFRTLATDGDVQLGGKDFDERLVNHFAKRFSQEHGVDPRTDPSDALQLWVDAQDAKHALTERSKTAVVISHAGMRCRFEIARQDFENLTADLLARTETTTSLVLAQAGLTWRDIARVLLVGGATRMPMVTNMLARLSGKEPDSSESPDETVAHGAAIYADMLFGNADSSDQVRLINVNSHSLGVVGIDAKTRQKVNVVLIPKNSALPCRAAKIFRTYMENQQTVKVTVVEGESHRPEHCIRLGECIIRDLPPHLPKGAPVEVEYEYSLSGRLSVRARLPQLRHAAAVEIDRDRAITTESLQAWRERLGAFHKPTTEDPSSGHPTVSPLEQCIKRLDRIYVEIGVKAASVGLPASLARIQQVALAAAKEMQTATFEMQVAERRRAAAQSQHELLEAGIKLAQASQAKQEADRRNQIALIELGRDCVKAGVFPEDTRNRAAELRQLELRITSGQ